MNIKGIVTMEIDASKQELYNALRKSLGFYNSGNDSFYRIKDNVLQIGEDVSYHGSPCYKYINVSDDPELIEVYRAIEVIGKHLKVETIEAPHKDPVHAAGACYCSECKLYTNNIKSFALRDGFCTRLKDYCYDDKKPTDFCSYGKKK